MASPKKVPKEQAGDSQPNLSIVSGIMFVSVAIGFIWFIIVWKPSEAPPEVMQGGADQAAKLHVVERLNMTPDGQIIVAPEKDPYAEMKLKVLESLNE